MPLFVILGGFIGLGVVGSKISKPSFVVKCSERKHVVLSKLTHLTKVVCLPQLILIHSFLCPHVSPYPTQLLVTPQPGGAHTPGKWNFTGALSPGRKWVLDYSVSATGPKVMRSVLQHWNSQTQTTVWWLPEGSGWGVVKC